MLEVNHRLGDLGGMPGEPRVEVAGQGDGGEDGDATGANGTLQSYGTEALAKAIATGGGFGIAQKIIQQVTAEDAAKGSFKSGSKV